MKGKRSKEGGGGGGSPELFEGEIKITHDKATNSLVIVSTTRDFSSLRQVIDKLDIPRRQVFVEAIIMEVSLEKMLTLGVATNGGTAFKTGDENSIAFGATTFSGLSTILIDPTSLMGLAVGLRGPEISEAEGILGTGISIPAFGVLLNALQTNNDVNILSTPHILATDNEEASITVGGNVPIQQGFGGWGSLLGSQGTGTSATSALGGLTSALGPMVSVGRQNVGLTLKIKPHINESDQIRFEIEIEISEVAGETSLGPNISQRMAKTVSVVKDQQTVVLGGLITDNQTETIDKVPVLGDIPVLGYLFKKKKTRKTKRNLLIFMTPYIIRDATDFRQIFNRKMEERREFIEQMTSFESKDYEPAIDYNRTNGILEEIHKTMIELEEEKKMLDELTLKPPPEHKVGVPIDMFEQEPIEIPSEEEPGVETPEPPKEELKLQPEAKAKKPAKKDTAKKPKKKPEAKAAEAGQ
jgi:general secretion pathway protein D